MAENSIRATEDDLLDQVEATLSRGDLVFPPVTHHYGDGLYIREIEMAAGTILTSKEHATTHPAFILSGSVYVRSANEGTVHYKAPCFVMTQPGTRRVLYVAEDCRWITVHPNPNEHRDHEKIKEEIINERENPLVPAEKLTGWKGEPKIEQKEEIS